MAPSADESPKPATLVARGASPPLLTDACALGKQRYLFSSRCREMWGSDDGSATVCGPAASARPTMSNVCLTRRWCHWVAWNSHCFICQSMNDLSAAPITCRSVKLLTERVTNIEQYLRDISDRDRVGRLSPKFRDARHDSIAESDGSKGTRSPARLSLDIYFI